jgi:hypothetical protein
LAIVLSVRLRFTDSDYPFGILKVFLMLTDVESTFVELQYVISSWSICIDQASYSLFTINTEEFVLLFTILNHDKTFDIQDIAQEN